MRPDPARRTRSHFTSLERLEDRLAMNADAIYDFWADAASQEADESLTELAVTVPYANQQTGVTAVRNAYGFTGAGQTVAVIDTGIAWDHYALGRGYGEEYRVVGGWDFAENDANPYDDGPAGFHGTHVSGIVGSSDTKYAGVAPGVDFVGLRVFNDQGAGKFEWVEQALRWVHEHRHDFENPITTVNLSLGAKWNASTLPNWATLEDELKQLYDDGIFVSVAAGNDFATYNATGLSYPAVSPYVVAVGSVTSTGVFSSFSQRADKILAAPGQGITSAVPDWLYGGNGIANDYGAASGTSMAAPYVAGAATLVRQAMEFVGMTNITQDTVYHQLRSTADAFYDTATQANYFRINVGRAIDSLMPSDDFGNTTTTGARLGTLGSDTSLSGVVGKLNDVDSFTFTAGVSGKLTLDATVRDYLTADIKIVGATAQSSNGQLSFEITAGQQYTIQIGTKSGIGHYTLDVGIIADQQPTTPVTHWGEIAFAQFANQQISGESWFQISATRSGILSLETFTNGNLRVELLDANRQVIASISTAANYGRLDATVQAGGSYLVRVIGEARDADFRLTNLVSQSGNTVNIFGTAGADTFSFTAGSQHLLDINGVSYRFDARAVTNVNFSGQGGSDSATLIGSAQHESASFTPTSASLASATYRVIVNGASQVSIDGRAGSDRLELTGSAGDDVLSLARNDVSLIGGGVTLRGSGFSIVNVNASSGNDLAQLYDTSGNDRFTGYATHAALQGAGYLHTVRGFDRVTITASGGDDTAYLYDSAGNDIFQATPTSGTLAGQGYSNTVVGFDRVFATASGGHDVAYLVDSAGNDRFYGRHNVSWLTGGGFYNSAARFDQTFASATAGGIDIAYLYDNAGDGVYYTSARQATVRGESFENSALGFAKVSAYATQSGIRTQMLETANSPTENAAAYFADLGTHQAPLNAITSNALSRAQLAELLVSFDFITAQYSNRGMKDETRAVDYLFAQEGQ